MATTWDLARSLFFVESESARIAAKTPGDSEPGVGVVHRGRVPRVEESPDRFGRRKPSSHAGYDTDDGEDGEFHEWRMVMRRIGHCSAGLTSENRCGPVGTLNPITRIVHVPAFGVTTSTCSRLFK